MYPNYNPDNGKIENSYQQTLVVEEARNNYRTKSFHKADVAINRDYLAFGKHEANFSLGFYNLYNRANPYIYFITQKRNANGSYKPVLKSMQIFPILPSFSWMMRFWQKPNQKNEQTLLVKFILFLTNKNNISNYHKNDYLTLLQQGRNKLYNYPKYLILHDKKTKYN